MATNSTGLTLLVWKDTKSCLIDDQQRKYHNFVDSYVVCRDGYIPTHRCVLTDASDIFDDALYHMDSKELATIRFCSHKIVYLVPIITLFYNGNVTILKKQEQMIRVILEALDFDLSSLKSYPVKPGDRQNSRPIQFFRLAKGEEFDVEKVRIFHPRLSCPPPK